MKVAVTGGAGQIAYNVLFRIASGEMLGQDQPIALKILDIEAKEGELGGVKMELEDCAFPLVKEIGIYSDPRKAFEGVHLAILIGASPRGPGMERSDLLMQNSKIFIEQGRALNEVADKNVKVLVVGNPCNTNALIAMREAPSLNPKHFFAMTRLDQNRAASLLAKKANARVDEVSHMVVWGNHSSTQVPDYFNASIKGKPAREVVNDNAWLENSFIPLVQNRGAEVIKVRGKSSAASAAHAVIDSVRSFMTKTPQGEWFSLGILSDENPYGIKEGLIYSFPCTSKGDGQIEIVKSAEINEILKEKLKTSEKELIQEKEIIEGLER